MITDPISDMLTRIRNALSASKPEVLLPSSTMKYRVAKILEQEGYLARVERVEAQPVPLLRLTLKYDGRQPAIRHIRRVSTPGHRVYAKATELPRVLSDLGFAIVSTSNGLMTNKEARARRLGGEVLCEVS